MTNFVILSVSMIFGIFPVFQNHLSAQKTTAPKCSKSQGNTIKRLRQDWFNLNPNKLLAETINGITRGKLLKFVAKKL